MDSSWQYNALQALNIGCFVGMRRTPTKQPLLVLNYLHTAIDRITIPTLCMIFLF